ncbi:6-phosphogluconate dehydrogenase (decarboxylating) [Candidatus Daviesbacteria bacterium RIFCSPHIGHO2_02_FULL_39_41]|nr:MAG: 6-phosphogluconate dehydrogenase (decarboxylating) [Candidatus Daviesbacteria bacterium RIFCSPHIGHO2_02_FULL_39_41]
MKIGFIGLGRMGKNMVLNLREKGIDVVAWNRTPNEIANAKNLDDLISKLKAPRIIWLMVTAGEAVDQMLNKLVDKLEAGDLVIDGGNSFYKDTLRRSEILSKKGIHFMDVGTSGGIEGARHGACMMIGGTKEDYERVLPVLKAASAPNAFGLLGPVGAGHFAKTIHNGIEYGMMEAIGEGATILKHSPFKYDLREVFRIYNTRSIIESRLVEWTLAELKEDPNLAGISSVIGSAGGSGKTRGEAHWTVELAKEMCIDIPVIKASIKIRDNSDKDKENSPNGFRNKVVAAMRWQFGQHQVKKK